MNKTFTKYLQQFNLMLQHQNRRHWLGSRRNDSYVALENVIRIRKCREMLVRARLRGPIVLFGL